MLMAMAVMKARYFFLSCLVLCFLGLLAACAKNSSPSTSDERPLVQELNLTSYETQILVSWENFPQPNAILDSLVLRWVSLDSGSQAINRTIETSAELALGFQQALIEGLTNNTQYRVELIGYYQRTEQICNDDCNICYTAHRRLDEYYQVLLGRGTITTGHNPDGSYQLEPIDLPTQNGENAQNGENGDEGNDRDGDGVGDLLDPDDDGNGLIEITTPAELYNIRYALDGSGKAVEAVGQERSISLITSGCEGLGGTTSCYGYELMGNISLADYDWIPLALDEDNAHFPVIATSFSGHFDGRGYGITNLSISQPASSCVGLFGNIEHAKLANLTLSFTHIEGEAQVASLVGRGENLTIDTVSIEGETVQGSGLSIGGLIGNGNLVSINHSGAHIEAVQGAGLVGGLAGSLPAGRVEDSHVNVSIVIGGTANVGGLIGNGYRSSVISSSVYSDRIIAFRGSVGGLIGDGYGARVISSSAQGLIGLSSAVRVGGLIGDGRFAWVYNSSATRESVVGLTDVGGLIGSGQNAIVNHSFAVKEVVLGREDSGGLIGDGEFAQVSQSHSIVEAVLADREAGGLIGDAEHARISSSYVEFDLIESLEAAGGLVADGEGTEVAGVRAEGNWVRSLRSWSGGLMGSASDSKLEDSEALIDMVSGRLAAGLVGQGDDMLINQSLYNGSLVYGFDGAGGLLGKGASSSVYDSIAKVNLIITDGKAGGLIGEGVNSNISTSQSHTQLVYSESSSSGGLVAAGEDVHIVASYANSSFLCGRDVGGLVGSGSRLRLHHSYALTANICDAELAGGLIGRGDQVSVVSSYAEIGMIGEAHTGGGLIGGGNQAVIRSSYAISETINASEAAGGLIGYGDDSIVLASYALVNRLHGGSLTGGILAQGDNNQLVSSYAMATLITPNEAGALIGDSINTSIVSSYAVVGPLPNGGLIGTEPGLNSIKNSYWDLNVSQRMITDGSAKTTEELRHPTNYTGIYASWARASFNHPQLDGKLASYCDTDGSGNIEEEERSSTNRLWDFGNSSQYPALHCVVGDLAKQRAPRYFPPAVSSFLPDPPAPADPDDNESTAPEEPLSDPLIERQWYLDSIGIKELWAENLTGAGVHVAIADDALDFTHPDLIPNILINKSRNFLAAQEGNELYYLPEPMDEEEDGHGTSVAGIIAARGDNQIGLKGVAPQVGIYLSNLLKRFTSRNMAEALTPRTNETVVISNSWGASRPSRLVPAREIFDKVVSENLNGLDGKGINYVFSAGNTRQLYDMASYEERLNHRGVITVCAIGIGNQSISYSNIGANLWLCAPSGDRGDICNAPFLSENINTDLSQCGIATTDLVSGGYNIDNYHFQPGELVIPTRLSNLTWPGLPPWNFDGGDFYGVDSGQLSYLEPIGGSREYTRFFSGTSAAAPIVSGVIAVLRSAYPKLTWRDTKLILAESATKVDQADANWQPAARGYANSSHFYNHSIYHGFGAINAAKANQLAKSWRSLPAQKTDTADEQTLSPSASHSSVNIQSNINFIEWTEIEVESDQEDFGTMELVLVSPQGTRSLLTRAHFCFSNMNDCGIPSGFTFATAANLGQAATGNWRLEGKGLSSDLKWELRFYGH